MIRKILFPLLAVAGIVMAIYSVRASNREVVAVEPVASPAISPYPEFIAGAGIIEASTENIAIGTLVPGVVTEVFVNVGDKVKKGDPLFKIDDREPQANLRIEQAALATAKEQLGKLEAQPRAEDIPPLEARVRAAQATLNNRQREHERLRLIGTSVSRDELDRAFWNVQIAQADVDAAQAELARVKAGAWKPDIEIARAAVASAQAKLDSIQVEIDRRTVRAKVDATVLQVKIRAGEYATTAPLNTPLMLLGDTDTLHVRVDIDENDAWRLKPNSPARASVRGNSSLGTDIFFVKIEPYIVPKRNLTGDSSERVDTRVLQVIYAFKSADFEAKNGSPIYAGQQVDVFVEVKD